MKVTFVCVLHLKSKFWSTFPMSLAGNLEMVSAKALPKSVSNSETVKLFFKKSWFKPYLLPSKKNVLGVADVQDWWRGQHSKLIVYDILGWWYKLVETCMSFHLQFESCPKLLTHVMYLLWLWLVVFTKKKTKTKCTHSKHAYISVLSTYTVLNLNTAHCIYRGN